MKIKKNKDITNLTTMRIRGKTKYYLEAKSVDDIKKGVEFAKKHKIPYCFLGNGSKVLFKENPYPGLIIHNAIRLLSFKNKLLRVGSGVKLPQLVSWCKNQSIKDFEWAEGIPGTVGGAIFMNAGAFGSTISGNLTKVVTLNLDTGRLKKYRSNQLAFKHRYSPFQKNKKNEFILEAYFKAIEGNKEKIAQKIKENKQYRQKTQPIKSPTLGSTFKQVIYKGKKISAGFLLDKAGCKKLKIGGAEVSGKHANFIINKKDATAKDVLKLVEIIKKRVEDKFGVKLELEIRII